VVWLDGDDSVTAWGIKSGRGFEHKVGLIWSAADVLRADYQAHEYGQGILSLTCCAVLTASWNPPGTPWSPRTKREGSRTSTRSGSEPIRLAEVREALARRRESLGGLVEAMTDQLAEGSCRCPVCVAAPRSSQARALFVELRVCVDWLIARQSSAATTC
jgi:hypothetical protein